MVLGVVGENEATNEMKSGGAQWASPDSVFVDWRLESLRDLFGTGISLKICPFLETKHIGKQIGGEAAEALVVNLGCFVEALTLGLDAVFATFQLCLQSEIVLTRLQVWVVFDGDKKSAH